MPERPNTLLDHAFPGEFFDSADSDEPVGYTLDNQPTDLLSRQPETWPAVLEFHQFGDDLVALSEWLIKLVSHYHDLDPNRQSAGAQRLAVETCKNAKRYVDFIIESSFLPLVYEDGQSGRLSYMLLPITDDLSGMANIVSQHIDLLIIALTDPDRFAEDTWDFLRGIVTEEPEPDIITE